MEFSDFDRDILQEICNMGVSHAANSLSQMAGRKISISVPSLEALPPPDVYDKFGGKDAPVVGILVETEGDAKMLLFLIFSRENARGLVKIMMGTEPAGDEFTEMELSAIQEAGNILGSHFTSTLADFLELDLKHKPPELIDGTVGEVLDRAIARLPASGGAPLAINTEFIESSNISSGYFFILSEKEFLDQIITKAKSKLGM